MPDESAKTGILRSPAAGERKSFSLPERRRQQRYAFTADAEAVDLRSKTRLTGRCSDLGLGGCYVDSLTPFAAGADVRIRLARNGRAFEAIAVVAYSQHALGMGMRFTEMTREHEAVLRAWLAELAGQEASAPADTERESGSSAQDTNMLIVLNQLIAHLVRKKILTHDEGVEFLRRMFR